MNGSTVNVRCHVSATSVPPVRDFRISPEKIDLKEKSEKGMREWNKYKKKIFWKVKSQVEVLAFGAYVFES